MKPGWRALHRVGLWLAVVATLLHALAPAWAQAAVASRAQWVEVCSVGGMQRVALPGDTPNEHIRCLVCLSGDGSAPLPALPPGGWIATGSPVAAAPPARRPLDRQPHGAASPRGPPVSA